MTEYAPIGNLTDEEAQSVDFALAYIRETLDRIRHGVPAYHVLVIPDTAKVSIVRQSDKAAFTYPSIGVEP